MRGKESLPRVTEYVVGKKVRSFIDGEIVFREGEAGDSAFVVRRGRVALSKDTRRGPVEIEVLGKGSHFGEIGVLNGGKRTLTATAVGDLWVDVVAQKEFKNGTKGAKTPPARSPAKMEPVANSNEPATVPAQTQSWFTRLFSRQHRDSSNIEVRIVPLTGEKGDRHARNIYDALARREGLSTRVISGEGAFTQKTASKNVIAACVQEGRDLLQKSGGDLLIWGNVSIDQKVLHLHFTSSVPQDEELPGSMSGFDVLPIPVDISAEWSAFLYATIMAVTVPFNTGKANILKVHMESAIEEGAPAAHKPPRDFTTMDRAHLINCLAHILAVAGQRLEEHELLQLAGESYQRAIDGIPEDDALHRGLTRKNLGCIQALNADRANDVSLLRKAAESMRIAIELIPRRMLPREWAAAQNRLGQILYRLHMADAAADTGLLTDAITAFQSAVQVYTRVDAPERWADVMNSYAQATQILGGQLHDPVVLQKAVNACRNALEVRRRDRTPFLWAGIQNTLGSALFLMGKITNKIDHLESALDAFRAAHEIYAAHNTGKMARVIARNMEHVQSLLSDHYSSGHYRTTAADDVSSNQIDENWWRENVVDEREHRALG